jgi:predicted membrane protein (TIGR00267 family)
MKAAERIRFLLRITQAQGIARRYFVTNGFDGALTMLGLTMGFYTSGNATPRVAIGACLGAAVALGVSGLTSAYISESAERKKELQELEQALVTADLENTDYGKASRLIPLLIAAVNGLAPFLISLLIIAPLWLAQQGIPLPFTPLASSIALAFVIIFLLGVFLGGISGVFWFWMGLRTLVIALITALLILFLDISTP